MKEKLRKRHWRKKERGKKERKKGSLERFARFIPCDSAAVNGLTCQGREGRRLATLTRRGREGLARKHGALPLGAIGWKAIGAHGPET
jgi:hypothetical protein